MKWKVSEWDYEIIEWFGNMFGLNLNVKYLDLNL